MFQKCLHICSLLGFWWARVPGYFVCRWDFGLNLAGWRKRAAPSRGRGLTRLHTPAIGATPNDISQQIQFPCRALRSAVASQLPLNLWQGVRGVVSLLSRAAGSSGEIHCCGSAASSTAFAFKLRTPLLPLSQHWGNAEFFQIDRSFSAASLDVNKAAIGARRVTSSVQRGSGPRDEGGKHLEATLGKLY